MTQAFGISEGDGASSDGHKGILGSGSIDPHRILDRSGMGQIPVDYLVMLAQADLPFTSVITGTLLVNRPTRRRRHRQD
jgi:hypothetical protein